MFTILCLEHQTAISPDADARVNVHGSTGIGMWAFTTKPYARQRSSGAPPG